MSYNAYLLRLPSSYYFRYHIPPALQTIVGRKEIRYSLRCGSLTKAKTMARLLAGRIQRFFMSEEIMEFSKEQIQQIVRRYVQETLDKSETDKAYSFGKISRKCLNDDLAGVDAIIEDLNEKLTLYDYEDVFSILDGLLQKEGVQISTDSKSYALLSRQQFPISPTTP